MRSRNKSGMTWVGYLKIEMIYYTLMTLLGKTNSKALRFPSK